MKEQNAEREYGGWRIYRGYEGTWRGSERGLEYRRKAHEPHGKRDRV